MEMTTHRLTHAPRVAVIGAGFSGIAAAIALQKAGIEDYTIFEASEGIGGTWWKNRYPGAEVDLESHIYSFSYARSDWTRTHASWRELQQYLEDVCTRFELRRHIILGEKVDAVRWSEENATWDVQVRSGRQYAPFTAVISAVGFLNLPLVPPFARGETAYEGVLCHTSAWPDGLDLTGKRVGVLGTGSSGVQVISEAAKVAESVKIFQLEPNWLVPKNSKEFSPWERRWNRMPLVYELRRRFLYARYDIRQARTSQARRDGRENKRRARISRGFLQKSLAGRPDLLELATPGFPFEGRRTVLSDDYYPTLLRDNVNLVPHGVKDLTKTGALDANGDEHILEVIILATGFDAVNMLGNYTVTGSNHVELHHQWAGEPTALLGLMAPNFPNFFMMFGPNTNAVPLISFYEAQGRFAAETIKEMSRRGYRAVEVSSPLTLIYNEWIQAQLRRTVWAEVASYFTAGSGKIVSQWPFSPSTYILATRLARRIALRFSY